MINDEILSIIEEFKIDENRVLKNKNKNFEYISMNYKEKYIPIPKRINCYNCPGVSILIPGKHIGICGKCRATTIHIQLTNYQKKMLEDDAEQKVYLSSPGVGKTTVSSLEWFLFAMKYPGTKILCMAPTIINLNNIAKQELRKYFIFEDDQLGYTDFLVCNENEWKINNGARFLWVPSDKEEKIRGENASGVWVLEANYIKPEILAQLEIRSRSLVNAEFETDEKENYLLSETKSVSRIKLVKSNRKFILESNNDADYLRDHYVLNSDKVFYTRFVPIDRFIMNHNKKASQIITSRHTYLIDMLCSPNQDEDYLLRRLKTDTREYRLIHIFCDMFYQDREIIKGWKDAIRYQMSNEFNMGVGAPYPIFHITDFGETMACTTILTIMYDTSSNTFWVVDVYAENKLTIREHAQNMLRYKRRFETPQYFEVVHAGDNSANRKVIGVNEINTVSNQYRQLGVTINTTFKGLKHPDNAILTVNKMIKDKKLFIFGGCEKLIEELNKYQRIMSKKTGELKLPNGAREGKTFDLIDSLYMFSMLINLVEYDGMYSELAIQRTQETIKWRKTQNIKSNSTFEFLW